jgi:hypothetical protein
MKTFKSKIGMELVIPIALILGINLLVMAYLKIWPAVIILLLVAVFIVHLLLTTYYQINGDSLKIKSGLIYSSIIDIRNIKRIVKTRIFISAPATSLDRLEILYNKFDMVIISPEDKDNFVKELIGINPDIEVKL